MACLPWIVVCLYFAAVTLPTIGLVKLFRRASSESDRLAEASPAADGDVSISQQHALVHILRSRVDSGPGSVRTDFFLIGGGIVAGSLGGILGLIPVFTFA